MSPPVPYKTLHMAHIELEHFDDFCVCVWERPRGWGGQDFPSPLLPVCRNREKRESIMQIMSTPFSQKPLPPIGTASGKLRTAQQLYKHGTSTLGTHPCNPNANCKVRALPSACPRAGSTTNLQVWQSLPLPPIRAAGTTRSSLRGRCWWSLRVRAGEGSLRLGPRAVRLPFHLSPKLPKIPWGGILIESWAACKGLSSLRYQYPWRLSLLLRGGDSTAWHRKINQCTKPSQGKQQLLKSHLPINNLL